MHRGINGRSTVTAKKTFHGVAAVGIRVDVEFGLARNMQFVERHAGQGREGAAGLALAILAVANPGHGGLVVDTVADGAAKALSGD